jgi:hypothetical protein
LAIGRGDAAALIDAVSQMEGATIPEGAPASLRVAIERMLSLCEAAAGDASGTLADGGSEWLAAAAAARQSVVRMSLELRLVVSVTN